QGFHATGGARFVRATAGHEHRVRRGTDLPGASTRLQDGNRADPLVRPAWIEAARPSWTRPASRLGPVPNPFPAQARAAVDADGRQGARGDVRLAGALC